MTTTAPTDAVARYLQLDEQTAAVVAAAYGADPTIGDGHDLDRLDGIVTAVVAGQGQAREMTRDAMTPAEAEAPDLAPTPPVDSSHLRARIAAMPDADRALFLAAWPTSGAPTVLAEGGEPVLLAEAEHAAVERLIATHEPAAHPGHYAATLAELAAVPSGPRFRIVDRARHNGIENVHDAANMTAGRLATLARIIEQVTSEARDTVADELGPVVAGRIVTEPVADVAALVNVPPDGKVDDVLAWVGTDPARAALALNAEERRAKPRKALLTKLAQTAGVEVPPTTAPPSAPPLVEECLDPASIPGQLKIVSGGDGELASSWAPPSPPDMLAIADRLVTVAEELNQLVELLTGVAVDR